MAPSPECGFESGISTELTANLSSIRDQMAALSAEIEAGEPALGEARLGGQVALWLKRKLYRLLWWHSYQIKAAVSLLSRWTREERESIHALAQRTDQRIAQIQRASLELENRIQQLESARLVVRVSEIERTASETAQAVDALGQRLEVRAAELERSAQETTTGLAQRIKAESVQTQQIAARLSELGLSAHQTRASLSMQDHRLALFIEEARKRLPEPFEPRDIQAIADDHTRHRFDSLYAEFEDVFRGTRDEVKARQEFYLPLLRENGIGSPAMPLLDLGCGRGEFVELLGEHGLQARGLDRNEAMIGRCKSLGLDVVQADALPYLGTLADGCLGAVTAFHMVEHMPFDVVLTLVDECLRVLKPGGILILETPNPANFQVGALTFHLDPTHLKPLPSVMLRFFVEGRGFCDAHVRELHRYPEVLRFAEDGTGVASRLNEWFYGPQDYAVIGRKA